MPTSESTVAQKEETDDGPKPKKIKVEADPYFSFDDLDIIGVDTDDVFLRGSYSATEDRNDPCMLITPRKVLHETLEEWLQRKADLCACNGHFCGSGTAYATDYTRARGKATMRLDSSIDRELKPVPLFVVTGFAVDMEHG